MSSEKDVKVRKGKDLGKLLGGEDQNVTPNKPDGIKATQKPGAEAVSRSQIEPTFTDEKTSITPTKIRFPKLAAYFTTKLISGRSKISEEEYKINYRGALGTGIYLPANISTRDGATVSALSIGSPDADHCIIYFLGKDGNFQDFSTLQKLSQLSEQMGARVIAFNYRDNPKSPDSFVCDAAAVTRWALSDPEQTKNISFMGESMGGAVAAETAACLQKPENGEIKVRVATLNTPKSLAYAAKLADLIQLVKNDPRKDKAFLEFAARIINNLQKVPRNFVRDVNKIIFGRDFHTEASLNELPKENVRVFKVEGDLVVGHNATAGHDHVTTTICSTEASDKHNADWLNLKIKHEGGPIPSGKDSSAPDQQEKSKPKTEKGIDSLKDFFAKPIQQENVDRTSLRSK